jgi:hypothetical protein
MMSGIASRAVVGLLVAGVILSACTSSGGGKAPPGQAVSGSVSSPPSSGAPVSSATQLVSPGPARGTVVLSLGPSSSTLDVQLCIRTPQGNLNLTAIGAGSPAPTLTVNLAKPVSGSTLVYTTRRADNSFTTHSMATSNSTRGSVDGLRVRVTGSAVEQAYTPTGAARGRTKSETVAVDGECQVIRAPNPAPQYGSATVPSSR